ncbi:glycosyltransferase family 2 protein [Nodosilinea sp. LEGE 07088]|uniref:glycosyltransferase family 2 protein n=1 Tax=Nodosilinea sp. LEGE 07088 TaxID=2777968 RepID=UPI00188225D6|nr:glycosyltransferase family 2 protein [Nodosilinea sp. LEGE 07088]MBE9139971.1 glycosyltransferase family 2 protein [Nodosilinea sp. LEGE 07088]
MKFSLVITTYNRLELLKRAIACGLNQTVPCEVVVADDASTDGTAEYVRSLGDRVVYHRNAHNLNHAATVNHGVAVASGEWVKFLDDDDYLAPDCIERMEAAIAQHPQAVLCSCRAIQVDEQGTELRRTATTGPGQVFYIPQSAIHYGMLMDQVPFGTPAQVAARRDAFLQAGGWDTTMTTNYDDIDAWVKLADFGDALFINACLAYRTLWPGGYEQKMSLTRRMALNLTIKERIYGRVSEGYRDRIPTLAALGQYLHLHWGLVALRQRQVTTAISLLAPSALSPKAWQLLAQARRLRATPEAAGLLPRTVLVP